MTAHELAQQLLAGPDIQVVKRATNDDYVIDKIEHGTASINENDRGYCVIINETNREFYSITISDESNNYQGNNIKPCVIL